MMKYIDNPQQNYQSMLVHKFYFFTFQNLSKKQRNGR